MIIEVTQQDIDDGEPCEPSFCFLALAIKRITGKKRVFVDYTKIMIDNVAYYGTIELEQDMVMYDTCGVVTPKTYELKGAAYEQLLKLSA